MNRTAIILLTLAFLTIAGGYVLGGAVEKMAADIQQQRTEALAE